MEPIRQMRTIHSWVGSPLLKSGWRWSVVRTETEGGSSKHKVKRSCEECHVNASLTLLIDVRWSDVVGQLPAFSSRKFQNSEVNSKGQLQQPVQTHFDLISWKYALLIIIQCCQDTVLLFCAPKTHPSQSAELVFSCFLVLHSELWGRTPVL